MSEQSQPAATEATQNPQMSHEDHSSRHLHAVPAQARVESSGTRDDVDALRTELAALRQAYDEMAQLYDVGPVCYLGVDRQGRITGANTAARRMLNAEDKPLRGHPMSKYLGEDDALSWDTFLLDLFEDGQNTECVVWLRVEGKAKQRVRLQGIPGPVGSSHHATRRFVMTVTSDFQLVEEALRKANQRYAGILHAMPELLLEVDIEGRFWEYFASNRELLFMPPRAFIGKTMNEIWPEETAQLLMEALGRVATTGRSAECQYPLVMRGAERWFEATISAKVDLADQQRFVLVIREVTERKRTEDALRLSERRFMEALESSRHCMYRFNVREDRYEYISPYVKDMSGYTPEEFMAKGMADAAAETHPEDWPRVAACAEEARTRAREEGKRSGSFTVDYRRRMKDGCYKWLSDWVTVFFGEDGKQEAIIGSAYDITERKEMEEALRASEELFSAAFHSSPNMMLITDLEEGRVVDVNQAWLDVIDCKREEAIGRTGSELGLSAEDERAWFLARLRAGEVLHNVELEVSRHGGEKRTILFSARALVFQEKPRVLAVATDITERKRAQEEARLHQQQLVQADKLASLGILVSGVAHEVNNPNHFIMSHVTPLRHIWKGAVPILDRYYEKHGDFIVAGRPYSETRASVDQMLSNIEEGSRRIRDIVAELRQYARSVPAEACEKVHLNNVVKSALVLTRNMLKKSTNCFTTYFAEDIPFFNGNYQRLEQVVINLVQNACQALRSPESAISVSTHFDKVRRAAVVTVRDEGVGMTQEDIEHATDPFYTTKRDVGGTGLGLSISSSIVMEHGGRLEFASAPGEGTTATVTIPLKDFHD